MGSIEIEIRKNYMQLKPAERKVADFLLNYGGEFAHLTITDLAAGAGVSQPTIIRFAEHMQLKGFKDLKYELMQDEIKETLNSQKTSLLHGFQIGANDRLEDVPANVIVTTVSMLKDTLSSISLEEFTRLICGIVTARCVFVFGVENSNCAVSDLVTKLLYLGINCITYADSYLQSVCANNLTRADLAIGISYSGCSKNTIEVLETAKRAGALTAAITNFSGAKISKSADINIVGTGEQFLYGNSIFSRTSQIAIVDMIYTGVLISNFSKFSANIDRSSKVIFDRDYREEEEKL